MKYLFVWAMAALMIVGVDTVNAAPAKKSPIEKMDTDKDGKVSKEEFVAAAEEKADQNEAEFDADACEATFVKKDANKDGFLTAEEMKAGGKANKNAAAKAADEDEGEDKQTTKTTKMTSTMKTTTTKKKMKTTTVTTTKTKKDGGK